MAGTCNPKSGCVLVSSAALKAATSAVDAGVGERPARIPAPGFGSGTALAIGPRRGGRSIDERVIAELEVVAGLAGWAVKR